MDITSLFKTGFEDSIFAPSTNVVLFIPVYGRLAAKNALS